MCSQTPNLAQGAVLPGEATGDCANEPSLPLTTDVPTESRSTNPGDINPGDNSPFDPPEPGGSDLSPFDTPPSSGGGGLSDF